MRRAASPAESGIFAPLSLNQRRLWSIEKIQGRPPAQVLRLRFVNRTAAEQFLQRATVVFQNLETLRYHFHELGELVVQSVGDFERVEIQNIELPALNAADEVNAAILTLERKSGPLLVLRTINYDDFIEIVVAAHSLAADPDTLSMALRKIAGKETISQNSSRSFLQYALDERADAAAFDQARNRWREALRNGVGALALDRLTIETSKWGQVTADLDADTIERIQKLCVDRGWSNMAYCFGIFLSILAHRYKCRNFIAFFAASMRTRSDLQATPGPFTTFVPIVCPGADGQKMRDFLEHVQRCVRDGIEAPMLPFGEALRLANVASGAGDRAQVLLSFLTSREDASASEPWQRLDTENDSDANFAWHFVVRTLPGRWKLSVIYDETIIERASVDQTIASFMQQIGDEGTSEAWSEWQEAVKQVPTDVQEDFTQDERIVAQAWETTIGDRPASRDQNFFAVGGSSVSLPRLRGEIAKLTGRAVNIAELVEHPTLGGMAQALKSSQTLSLGLAPSGSLAAAAELCAATWRAQRSTAVHVNNVRPKILIAGCTGFLGRKLTSRILSWTEFDVVLLARQFEKVDAVSRLRDLFGNAIDDTRVSCGECDVSDPSAVLPVFAYGADIVVNAAAEVNFVYPFEALLGVNVLGLGPLLTAAARDAMVVQISTLGIFDFAQLSIDETVNCPPRGGYPQTKWVADAALLQLDDAHLQVDVLRPGWVIGEEASGDINRSDLIWRLVRTIVTLGLCPDIDFQFYCSPVEALMEILTRRLRSQHVAGNYTAFNLPGLHYYSYAQIVSQLRHMGVSLRTCSYDEWSGEVRRSTDIGGLRPLLDEIGPDVFSGMAEWSVPSTEAQRELNWPQAPTELSAETFRKYASVVLS